MREAASEISRDIETISQNLQHIIGHTFISRAEISAQEAVVVDRLPEKNIN